MPCRTSGMRMLRALNAEATELTPAKSPTPTPELPVATEKQGFNFDAYRLGVKATKLAVRMRGLRPLLIISSGSLMPPTHG